MSDLTEELIKRKIYFIDIGNMSTRKCKNLLGMEKEKLIKHAHEAYEVIFKLIVRKLSEVERKENV